MPPAIMQNGQGILPTKSQIFFEGDEDVLELNVS